MDHVLRTHLRRLLGEISYAQSRSFELRTGIPVTGPTTSRYAQRQIRTLESIWESDPSDVRD